MSLLRSMAYAALITGGGIVGLVMVGAYAHAAWVLVSFGWERMPSW